MEKVGMKSVIQRLTFFIHGRNLLSPAGGDWIAVFVFLSVAMAILEGLTWGRIIAVFLPENLPWVAVFVGVTWGGAIYAIDRNFATLDTSPDYRKVRADGNNPSPPVSGWRAWLKNKLLVGTLFRVCIISVAMALTGPFLAQTLDERKVIQAIEAQNAHTIAGYRRQVAAADDARVSAVEVSITSARAELVKEVSGHSISGRRGCAVVCKTMEANITSLEAKLEQAKAQRDRDLRTVSGMTPQQLERDAGVVLLHDNADTRAKIRNQMDSESGDKIFGLPASHVLASALFLLIFWVMLLLKIYQPRSVAIYFNEHLQEVFKLYISGGYANLPTSILPAHDRHDGPCPMSAQRFDVWYHEEYLPSLEVRELFDRITTLTEGRVRAENRRELIEGQIGELRADKEVIEAEHQHAGATAVELEDRIVDQEKIIKATRQAKLNEELRMLEARRTEAGDRLDALRFQKNRKGDALEDVMTGIRKTLDRLGHLRADGAHDAEVDSNPKLQAIYAQRATLREQLRQIEADEVEAEKALEAIDAAIARTNEARASDGQNRDGDLLFLDPELRALVDTLRDLKRERDAAVADQGRLEQRLAECDRLIVELRNQSDHDAQQIRAYLAKIRGLEAEAHGEAPRKAA